MSTMDEWSQLSHCDGAPDHDEAMAAGYRPVPSIAEQNRTHGAPAPAVDKGPRPGEVAGGPPSVPGPRLAG